MSSGTTIYYLRQLLKRKAPCMAFSSSVQEISLMAHFYVQADDATEAGAVAGTFCVAQGLECVEYICLPEVLSLSQIDEHEDEHREAYELAQQSGVAMVASVVLTW